MAGRHPSVKVSTPAGAGQSLDVVYRFDPSVWGSEGWLAGSGFEGIVGGHAAGSSSGRVVAGWSAVSGGCGAGSGEDAQGQVAAGSAHSSLFGKDGTEEADHRFAVGEDPDDVGAAVVSQLRRSLGLFDQICRQTSLGKHAVWTSPPGNVSCQDTSHAACSSSWCAVPSASSLTDPATT